MPISNRPPNGAHIFVDETKTNDYIMAAASLLPGDVASARKVLTGLLLPRQERLHFTHERNARRRQLLKEFTGIDVQVVMFVARTKDHVAGRTACLEAIVDHAIQSQAAQLVLELDDSTVQADRRLIARRLRPVNDPPQYRHLRARSEPLLWVSDAVAWCYQRGGEWIRLTQPLVSERHIVL